MHEFCKLLKQKLQREKIMYDAQEAKPAGPRIKAEDMELLKEYAMLFDKLLDSKNPAVKKAWRDLCLLLVMTEREEINTSNKVPSPISKDSGRSTPEIFYNMAVQVERSMRLEKELAVHVQGLQYQIDGLKKQIREGRGHGQMPSTTSAEMVESESLGSSTGSFL